MVLSPRKLACALCIAFLISAIAMADGDDDGPGPGGHGDAPPGIGSGLPYSSNHMLLSANLSLGQIGGIGGTMGSGIWGWTDRTDPNSPVPREYALFGLTNGTSFVDVTNPSNPVYKGFLPTATGISTWRELRSHGNHAFIVSDGNGAHGMQVFDLRQLRNYSGTPISFSTAPSSFYTRYTGINNAHTIDINAATGFAYLYGTNTFSGGAHFVDINNPMTPVAAGGYVLPTSGGGTSRYVHDGQVVVYNGPDAAYLGREVLFAANGRSSGNINDDTVSIVDVSNKASPTFLGSVGHPDARYIHQGWLTPDQRYFLVDDELDEFYDQSVMKTHVYDVSDLDNPVYKGGWVHPHNSKVIDHNLFIKQTPYGLMAFESNYTMGLRVIRIDDLSGPTPLMTEWGWFDTYPTDDATKSFNGQWGNYPFFDSGTIIAGDRQNGLFILQVVPEPSTWMLLMVGGIVFAMVLVRRSRKRHGFSVAAEQ